MFLILIWFCSEIPVNLLFRYYSTDTHGSGTLKNALEKLRVNLHAVIIAILHGPKTLDFN